MTSAALWLLLGAACCRVVEVRAPRFQRFVSAGIALGAFAAWLLDHTTAAELWETAPTWWRADRMTWFFQCMIFGWLGGHLLLLESFPLEATARSQPPSRWLIASGAALLMAASGEWVRFTLAADLLALTVAADLFSVATVQRGEQSPVENSRRWWLWPVGLSALQWLGILFIAAETGSTALEELARVDLVMLNRNPSLMAAGLLLLLVALCGRMLANPVAWRIPDRLSLPETCRLIRNVGLPVCAILPFGLRFCASIPTGRGIELVCVCLILGLAAAAWAVFNLPGEESPVRSWLALFTLNTAWFLLGWGGLIFSAGEARESRGGLEQILRVICTAAGMQLAAMLLASLGWLALVRHLLRDQRDRWLWHDWAGLVKASPIAGCGFCYLWMNLLACPLSPGGWGRLGLLVPALLTILPGKGNDLVGQPVFRIAACGFVLLEAVAWTTAANWLRQLVLDEPLNTQVNRRWGLLGVLAIGCGVALLTGGLFPQLFIQHGPMPFRAGE